MYNVPLTIERLPEAIFHLRQEVNELKQLLKDAPSSAAAEADQLLTRAETADFLKVSEVTLWSWDKKGILNPRRIGNQVRYLKSEVVAANKPIRK